MQTPEELTALYAGRLAQAIEAGAAKEIDGVVWYRGKSVARALRIAYPKTLKNVAAGDKRMILRHGAGYRSHYECYISRDALLMWIRTKPGISYRAMVEALDSAGVPP